MIADEDCIIINADLSQVQYRIVAWEAREQLLMDAFSNGDDVYCAVGSRLYDKPADEVSREPGSSSLGDGSRSERDWAKTAALAMLFGLGPDTLAHKLEIPVKEGRELHAGIKEATPAIWDTYHEEVKKEIWETKKLVNCFGSKRLFLKPPTQALTEALAYKPQRTEQDLLVRRGMFPIWSNESGLFGNFEMLNQVHDSIVMQHKFTCEEDIEDIVRGLKYLREIMEKPFKIHGNEIIVPLDYEVGLSCETNLELGSDMESDLHNFMKEIHDAS